MTLTHGSTTRKFPIKDALLIFDIALAASNAILASAILRGPRISRRLILHQPLSRQTAASKIRNISPMVGKCCRNGIGNGVRVLSFCIELSMDFLVSVLPQSQWIVLTVLIKKYWVWLKREGRYYYSWSQSRSLISVQSKLMTSQEFR